MTKMSGTQRTAILDFHNGVTDKRHTMLVRSYRTLGVMVANGWAARVTSHTGNVTRAGLIAAGVDMDAIHAEALAEHADRLGILDAPNTPRARTFATALYVAADGTYAAARDILHEQAARDRYAAALDFNLPMGADMTLVTGETPAPEIEQCDDCESTGQNCWVHGGRERSWGRSAPAPTLADDVAMLRAKIGDYAGRVQDWRDGKLPDESEKGSMIRFGVLAAWEDIVARLDRIAGAVPVPTRVWMHRCGVVLINDTEPPPCHVCVSTPQIPFVRLYSLGEVA